MANRGVVTAENGGKIYTGNWSTDQGLITVSCPTLGQKVSQLGGLASAPEVVAAMLLNELIRDYQARSARLNG